jgi:uncharacterized protein (TIGR02466 family)
MNVQNIGSQTKSQSKMIGDRALTASGSFSRINYFPTMVFQFDLENSDGLNDSLLESIYAERDRDHNGVNKSNTAQLGRWHSNTGLHRKTEFAELLGYIDMATIRISKELGYATDHALKITTM